MAIETVLNHIKSYKKSNVINIGIYGDDINSGKNELFLNYLGKIPNEKDEFSKLFEFNNEFIKIKFNLSPNFFSDLHGIIFLFDISNEFSFNFVKNIIIKTYLSNETKIPYVLAANFAEKRNEIKYENDIIHFDDKTKNDMNCNLFDINSNNDEDIDDVLYYILGRIPIQMKEKNRKRKESNKKKAFK